MSVTKRKNKVVGWWECERHNQAGNTLWGCVGCEYDKNPKQREIDEKLFNKNHEEALR